MELKIKHNSLQKNPYNSLSFWEKEIIKENNLWEGYFDDKEITANSKIIYTGILDLNKNILQCGWAVYPCTYSLLGFLQYVYLPTAFFIWFDHKSDDLQFPSSNFDTVVNKTLKVNNKNVNFSSVNSMKKAYDTLNNLWNTNSNLLSSELNTFCNNFNSTWNNDLNQKLLIKIFDNPGGTFNFVKDALICDTEDFVEEDISMTLDAFKFSCDNAIKEPLLNRRFIDILNTNAPILF